MASRRQKQFDRKYSSYRKFTATEDVNYSTHSSRSSYRSESVTSRADGRGRSTSSEIFAGSETRSYPVYIAIQDFTPDKEDVEAIPLEQGQIVEVLDRKNSVRWLVRTKARPPRSGWVPGSYFETPTEYYKQRRRTREIENVSLNEEQAALVKRDQVYHELLRSEEEFVSSLRTCVDDYIKVLDDPGVPEMIRVNREQLALNVPELYNFHANVMLKGLNYYSDDPGKVGQTFVRLEKDFESHVEFYKRYSNTMKLLEQPEIDQFFKGLSNKNDAGCSSYQDHVKEIADRMIHYQNYFKEFVKYTSRAQGSSKSIQKALELVTTIPQRVHDLTFTDNLKQYPGDTSKLGRIIRHDQFQVWESDEAPKTRYVFLFPNKIMFTDQNTSTQPNTYQHYSTIRLDKYNIRQHSTDPDMIVLQPQEPGLPNFRIKPKDLETAEYVRKAWLKDISEEQEQHGPEEGGPPRKKVKSPPVISPTGSSTSIYSGGSSSIDWTTTGTTLEMQGTRVTRTQYGFRTLQESSAKMCLKVTGYPLPDITWYKDDVLLHEDERHTFYSDDDGFFAMTIDPVHVNDTGRYTCMATNEYGQASTSAFFRVMKVEKEAAPPAFVSKLRDQECKEGEVINFECEVEGWPEPELVWLVDDQPLRPSHDFRLQYDGQTAKLEIRDAQPDDTGVYSVKIQNEFGASESKAELFVAADPDKNHVAPEFQAAIEDVECDEGAEVRFKSVITGDPNPEITWFINGVALSESEKVKFISEDGICILTIKDVTRHFDGMVTCQGVNRLGSASCDARLKVRVPPAPPTFNKPLEDRTVQEKSSAVFEIDVSGWPEPTILFTLCGKELKHGEDGVEIVGHDGFYRLSIANTSIEKHDGEIIARAQNEHGTAESRARLTVEQEEEESRSAPTFIKDIEDQTVKQGEFAVFETTVRGNPNPEVTWFINGHMMDPSSAGVKIEAHNHDHKLTIDSAQYAGTVLCRAENVVGRFETKARLVVLAPEKPKRPPKFTEILVDKSSTEGKTITFEVRVEGEPKPNVTWYLKGEQIQQSERIEIREFDGSIKIQIKGLLLEESGEIKAIATNSEGSDETKSTLTVQKKPFAPTFDLKPSNLVVEKGSEAIFHAHAVGIPAPIYKWSINGRKIRDGQEGVRVSAEDGVVDGASILTIDTATYYSETNQLTISVVAENELGAEEIGAQLSIEPKKETAPEQQETVSLETTLVSSKSATETTITTATIDGVVDSQGDISISKIEVVPKTGEANGEGTPKRRVSFAEEDIKMEVIGVERKKSKSPEAGLKKPESPTKKEKSPEKPASPTKKEKSEEKPTSPTKKEKSPEKPASPTKKEKSEEKPASPTKKEKSEEKPTSPTKKEKSPEKPASPTKKEKSPEKPTSPTKKEKSPEKPASPTKKEKSPEKPASPTKKEKSEEKPASPTKKEKSPEKPTSPTKKEKSEEKPTSPTKKEKSPEKPASPTKKDKSEEKPASPTKKEKSPEKPASPTKKDKSEEKPASPTKKDKFEEKPASPTKKDKSEEKPASPTKKDKSEEKPASPTKKEKSPEQPASPTKKDKSEEKPASPTKKDKSEEKPASPTKKDKSEEKPASPTKKEKSPEQPTSPTKKEKSSEEPSSPNKRETGEKTKSPIKKSPPTSPVKVKSPEMEKPPAPKLTRDLKSQTVNKSDLAHFEVVVENAVECKWFLNGTEITKSPGVTVSNDDRFEFRCSIDTALFGSGTLSVIASNTSGTVETKTELQVLETPKETKKPEFTDKLTDMEVTKGDAVKMDVIALHSPVYKWYQNGNLLEDGKNGVKIVNEENKSSLRIADAQQSGTITVEASNEIGSSESSAKLTVNPPACAPTVIEGPRSVTIKESESAEFNAVINGFPEPTVKWMINEKVVEEMRSISKIDNRYTLKIANAKVEQSGKVTVTAQNSAGSEKKDADLNVMPNIVAPTFKSQLTDRNVDEGEPLRWNIEIDGPFVGTEVNWYLNGEPLTSSDTIQVVDHANGTYHVTIAEAKPEMSGTLTVKARNAAGECESSAKVVVNGGNRKPEFVQAPQNHETTLEESVKFSAIVSGKPTPNVSWFLNDRKLVQGEEVKVKYVHETGKTSIRIFKPLMEHNGTIRVEAMNVAGKVEATAQLKVDRKTEVPKFTTNMDDRQVKEGENVKYTANVEGYPEPSVSWTLNGEPAGKFGNVLVTDKDGEHCIEISSITPEQAGELSCEATNAVGTKKRDIQLLVKKTGDAPIFAKNLEDRLITEGEMTLMDAQLGAVKPKPKLSWFKDGVEIQSDEHFKLVEEDDGKVQLRIVTTKLEDKGRITLKAENEFGVAECSASLGVVKGRPMAKPAFQSDIAPINLTEGDTLECKLLITGDPTPFVKWYINGQLVCATEDTEMTNSNGVYTLKIHGVSADMTGKIKCVAYNKAGEVATEGALKVVAPIPVEFETSLCDATCREGDTLKLKAVLLGEPEPVVSWYVNGKKLEESQNIKIHSEKGTYTVTIKDITCDYSGQVVCEAVNEYGRATSEATLLVLPRGEPPDFLEWLSNVRARVGSKVVHKVVFTGDPKPVLTWYINNQEIQNSADYSIVTDEKTSVLTINSFNPELHVGEIICKAENDAGEVSCTANMITYTSDMFSESESEAQGEEFVGDDLTEDESGRDETHRTPTPVMAPKFITKIKDTKARKGHSAVFECVVPDTKGVCCKWLKDGKEIELIARIRVQTRTGPEGHITQELIIDDAKPEDAGRYTCVVENTSGMDTCEATLTVVESLEKVSNKAPEFVVALQDRTTKTAEKVVLECKVVGEPKPNIKWLHENKQIVSRESITIESIDGVERVTISSTEMSHQGKYTCIAENIEGTSKTEAFVTVQGEPPHFTKELQNVEIGVGEKLILSCSVKGVPAPHVEFLACSESTKTETKITSSSRISVEHDQTNTHWRMVISEIGEKDLVTYKAVATNTMGSAISTSKVTMKMGVPKIEQGLKKTSVKEKEEIKMEVKVGGTAPDVNWFKDDKPISEDANHAMQKNPETGVFTLIVKEAATSDAGKYTAKATNAAGSAESTADAEVTPSFEKPTFTKELVSSEVKISESATLSVSVKGIPEPSVEWLKNGQPVTADSNHVVVKIEGSGSHSITIKDARIEDTGSYMCRAVNCAGEAKTECDFAVIKDVVAPEFVEKLAPMEVKETETMRMSVKVVGKPEPAVQWFKDDTPINIDNVHVIEQQPIAGSFSLTIKDARQQDAGIYSCRARNEAGEAICTANFGIQRTSIPPEFTEKLKPLQVKEHEMLNLSVKVIGTPAPKVEWFKDDTPINIDGSHILVKDDGAGHHTLSINSARGEDVGVYTCKASNEAGEAKTTANMGVQEEIEAPLFVQGLAPIEVEQGKGVELVVKVEGKPEPEVKWFKDGAPIQIDNNHVIEKKGENGSHTLIINDTTPTDFGKYACHAINKAGKDETIGELKIPKYSFEKNTAEQVSPLFIEPLKETFAEEGKCVVMECKVNKESHPEVRFFKNGNVVQMDSHMQLEVTDDGLIRLTIQNARKEDLGAYRCEATNRAGKADTSAELKYAVKSKECVVDESGELEEIGALRTAQETMLGGQGAPEFVELLRSCNAVVNQQAVLKCKVKGEPKPKIRWSKDGKEVEMSGRVRATHEEDGTLTLTVDNVSQSDAGEYRCDAENEYGSAWTEGPIIVIADGLEAKIGGEAPDFLQPVRPAVVVVGETAVLEGKICGKPKATVKWYKNGKEIVASDRVGIEDLADGTQRLTIINSELSDQDEYRCSASNEFGDVWSDVTLTVKPLLQVAPGFFDELQAICVKETETARFECRISGTTPSVKWFKDGEEIVQDNRVQFESKEDGTQRLIIEKSKTHDQGNYRVQVTNDAGVANSKAPLTVIGAEVLKIKKGLVDTRISKGTKIILEVEVEGKPKSVKWYKGSEMVSSDSRTQLVQITESQYKLEIESGDLSDNGSYRVVLSTGTLSVESMASVTVTEGAEKISLPSFKKGLSDTTVPKGSPLVLEVEIDGKPKDVKWYRNGDEIKGPKAKIEDLGDGKYRLTVPEFGNDDIGEYSVTATNDAGEIESRAKVNVGDDGKDKVKPEIVSGLIPTNVKQGDTATFNIKVKGAVKGVKWYKNGKEIPDAKSKDNGDGNYSLEIPNAQLDDSADYKVVVSNDAGDADSSAALTVKLPDDGKDKVKPEIVSGLIPTSVKQGDTATFNIKVKGAVKGVKWYKNGKEIPDAKSKDNGDGNYSLEIPNAQLDDTADYKVVVSNDAGDADSSAALTVKLPGIKIVKGLEDTEVPKGSKVVLQVETNRKPKEVKWYKNGKEITPSEKLQPVFDGDNKPQLIIADVDEDDASEYKVLLKDDDDNTADSFCALTVKLAAEKPTIVKGLDDQIVPVGSPIELQIETTGSPKTVKWYKNGKELSGAKNIEKIDENKYALRIPASAIDDTGDYKVEVSNEAGSANSSANVTVEPKITFFKPLKDQTITEGENAEFSVEINTKPRQVKWYKNGVEIKPDQRMIFSNISDTKYSLTIKNAVRDDAANYKIVLVNSAGESDSSANLVVNKAKAGLCKIVKGLEDQVVAKGSKMVFEVKISGEPEEVRWLRDATVVSAGANAIIEKIDDTTYRLTIPLAELSDAGEYTVEVVNESGKAKSNANGEVDEKPEIVRGLENLEIPVGDEDVFKVEVSAPVRTVKWYKNGREIEADPRITPKKIGPKKCELVINKAQLDDGGVYKVVLGNAAGECDSAANLTITKPNVLKIIDGLKDIDVEENQPVELKIKVEGIPKSVKWYKNGQEIGDGVKLEENPESGVFSLLIPNSTKSDGGAYRVVLANDKGEVYSGCVVHVKAGKPKDTTSAANFLSPLKDTEVEEGDMLTLQCSVAGEPFPEVRWFKDGVELVKDERVAMRVALDGTATLRIRSATRGDVGMYRVEARNEAGSAESECKVGVKAQGEQPAKPKFVIPLKTGAALPGEKKEFNVKVRGFPTPAMRWFMNETPIDFDDRITIDDMADGNFCLTIKDVREEDFGTIRCVATNDLGSAETVCEFERSADREDRAKDDLRYPPRFNVPLWDRRIPVGDAMFIECHVDANPTAEIEWFKDGKKVEHSSHCEIRNSVDGACRLKIIPFEESDCGVYMCVAVNELGQAETQATYQVEIMENMEEESRKEYAPRINPPLEDRSVNEGQPIRLSCKVDAIPRASVVWYKDGLPLRSDSRMSIQYEDDGTATLSINESIESDIGAYRCVATNTHGTINTSCSVNVKVQKQEVKKVGAEPFFTKGLVDLWADRGDSFTLKCAVTGDPFPDVKWYRNGQLVRNGARTIIETSPDGQCTLLVKDCTMSDEGIYRCEAENAHGKAKSQATAHVQMAIGRAEKPKIDEGKPPKFIVELSDMTTSVGNVIDLECKVTGMPMPTVKWSKDGGPLIEDTRFEWCKEESKGSYQLRIKRATVHDEGTYRCVASNENGSATTKSFVRIDDGIGGGGLATGHPPRFTLKLGDVRTIEGQPLKLQCKIDASPLPELTWYKDGAIVEGSERVQLSLDADGTATLLIPSSVVDDEGLYRLIATNPSGTAQDKGNATVKKASGGGRRSEEREVFDANKAPKLVEPLENVRIAEKNGFRLRCKFSGEPKPSIKWYKDGERVFPYGRLQLNELPDGVCELVIDSSIRHDTGGYRCVAENTFGSARTSCDVNVQRGDRKPRDIDASIREGKAPGFTVPLTIRRAKPTESVTFECVPFGNPFPSIKWLKDGLEVLGDEKSKMESLPDGTQRLILSDVTFLTEGYFRCVATNEHGTASTKAELIIEGDRSIGSRPLPDVGGGEPEESKPRIRRGLYNMSIHEGNVVEMIVCATGWPTPTVKWFKDGEEIVSDGADGKRVIFTDERGIHHLVIVNACADDEGEYSLEATNRLGAARTEGSLNIIRPRHASLAAEKNDRGGMPFPPGFVRQLKNKHVFNHMPTIFDCLVVGYPAPDVEWFHNGKKIAPGGRVKIQSCGGGSHALIILDTTLEDAGEYVAVAKNSHGTASSSAVLDVTVPFLDNIKFNGEIDVTPYLTEEYGFKKLNTASLPTPPDRGPFIKEVTGHYLTLSWIPTKRAPPRYPQVTYVIEIRELPEKEWSLLDYNIPEPVCKVRNLELGKSYQFRVRAENIYGISDPSPASPPSRLMAPPQPVFDRRTNKIIPLLDPYAEKALEMRYAEQYACAPWFAPGVVEKRYCAENDTFTIILNVSGYPDPEITWKFRGWDIDTSSPTSKCKVYTYGGTETTLAITGFSKENVGQYQCLARNEYGEAQQNILVEMASRPNFIQPLGNKTFSSAHPMRLDVRVEGEPFPELKWMKEWRPIVESSRIKFVQDGPYLCSLIINDPMWRDSGIYSCVAINDAGQATTSCSVTVEADGDYNDVELPRRRVTIESRKVRELYEISENDEKLAAGGAPFRVIARDTRREYLAQLRPIDDALVRHVDVHNSLDHPGIVQMHRVLRDEQLALVVFENANSTIDGLSTLAHPGVELPVPHGSDRETCVRVFVRQLLLALKHLHDLRIAHLDLRPETILLQDDKLKLADFGQSRRLLRGLITGEIKGSPEFVSPEIVRSYPLTLATDMWSCGVLTYVLLSGCSPFHGDNDNETLRNVDRCQYDSSPLRQFSSDALDFIERLLLEIPAHRMTVDEALSHNWICDEKLKNEPLSADTLREFKYQHKWLERRVFVQQTPSEQILEAILGPQTSRAKPQATGGGEASRNPAEIYDYLRIKPRKPVEEVPHVRKEHPPFIDEFGQLIEPAVFEQTYGQEEYDPRYDPRRIPIEPPQPQRPNKPAHDSRRHENPLKDQLKSGISKVEKYEGNRHPVGFEDQPFYVDKYGRPVMLDEFGYPTRVDVSGEKRKLIPQDKGETPSRSKKERVQNGEQSPILDQNVPIRMIRGERREIEEEIANRILSDISEEGSIAGSMASLEDFEIPKDLQADPSEPSTPTLTPEVTIRESIPQVKKHAPSEDRKDQGTIIPAKVSYPDSVLVGLPEVDKKILEQAENDPSIPVGAPLFLEGLHGADLTVDTTTSASGLIKVTSPAQTLSPHPKSPRRSTPGTKSPVTLSPRQEHSMEVLIATKRGKPGFLPPGELAPEIDDEDAYMDERKKQLKPKDHDGNDFKDEKEKLEKDKNRRTVDLDDLDKYRPGNFYDTELNHPGYDIDDSPWDSHYQIGPDTYLMAARGAAFNSRVRNYREELFGIGAPTVKQGFLGVRNRDITVRERRRYTDIMRESMQGVQPKSNEHATALQHTPSTNAIDRIKADIEKVTPSATKKNEDGTFAPIFVTRLRDVYLRKNQPAIFECSVTSSPAPKIVWDFQGKHVENNGKVKIEQDHNISRLTILNPAPYDLGEYVCSASNEFGSDKTCCRLISGETPARPGRPECELSSDTELFIQWEAPDGPTYLEGIIYRLEYRLAGPNDHAAPWNTISERIDDESVVVKHLSPLGIYQFRVTARNGFGLGLPSLSSRIVQTHGKGAPKLQIDALKSEIRLNVVSMPQRSGNQLGGISEESEEDAEDRTLSTELHTGSHQLQTTDPTGRFQIAGIRFKGARSVIRDAVDSSSEAAAHCVVKIRHPASSAQVLAEYEALRATQHENVQRVIAAHQFDNFLYIFTERLYEDVFSRFVFNDYYTEEQIALTIRQVTAALHFLHFKGIAHLDVNPHNIMFQSKRSWIAKLVDFGRAQKLPSTAKPTEFDCKWASPEFHVADTAITVQSDVWGMGVVTFCLLAGFHPFTSEYDREDEVKDNVINVKCDPNLIPVNASQESLSFATWALKKSPMRRMRTDEALAHKFLSSDPSMVRRRESIKYSASRLRKLAAMIRQPLSSQTIIEELELKYGK